MHSASQALPGPLKAAGSGAPDPGLPVQLTDFIGRQREVAALQRLLGTSRLLTLTGTGGSGKTRLALEVAARTAGEFRDGISWTELAALSAPELVLQQIGAGLRLQEQGARPALDLLVDFLRPRSMLLVLDNCEHLVDACARLADTLLRGCPDLRILATSREALGVPGERAWLVPPLSLPDADLTDPDTAASAESVRLFVERARDAAPGFRLTEANTGAVARICRRLDGIPLAIELAAVRTRVLAPDQILARLNDAFALLTTGNRTALPRHRALRATIDWSFELLSEERKLLLRRLSVFSGGFTLEAAEAVCAGGEIEQWHILDVLTGLVDQSMVTMQELQGTARYSLLETVRQYGSERLHAAGEAAAVQARHAEYFSTLAAEAEGYVTTVERRRRVAQLLADIENVRQALSWTRDHHPLMHLRFVGVLSWFWLYTRHWTEGREWAERALTLPDAAARTRERAAALYAAGLLAGMQARPALAQPYLEESAAISAECGDRRQEAYALSYLSMALLQQGRPEGKACANESLAWFREAGDQNGARLSLCFLAHIAMQEGDVAGAEQLATEGVQIARVLAPESELAMSLQTLGTIVMARGDLPRAGSLYRESLEALRGDPVYHFTARALEHLAVVLCEQGAVVDGVRLLAAAEPIRELVGAARFTIDRSRYEASIAAAQSALGAERFHAAWSEGRALSPEGAIGLALEAGLSAPASGNGSLAAPRADPHVPTPAVQGAPGPADGVEPAAMRVLALGSLQISIGGDLLASDVWTYRRPMELLVFLLCHPDGRTREQIGLAFWPDGSSAQVKNSFHVALHRLRKTLGHPEMVVLEGERYRINPELRVFFDAAVFEHDASTALRDLRSGVDALDRLEKALSLYRGDFLDGESAGDWHLLIHDRLRRLYVDGLGTTGERMLASGALAEAAALYERLLILEDLSEEAYRNLMICRARMGDRAAALRLYERLVKLLREELDTGPEEATAELYARLRHADAI